VHDTPFPNSCKITNKDLYLWNNKYENGPHQRRTYFDQICTLQKKKKKKEEDQNQNALYFHQS
jgi:hypothetical protein